MLLKNLVPLIFVIVGIFAYKNAEKTSEFFTRERKKSGLYREQGWLSKKHEVVSVSSVRQTALVMVVMGLLGLVLRFSNWN